MLPFPSRLRSGVLIAALLLSLVALIPAESMSHPDHFTCFGRTATKHATPGMPNVVGTDGPDVLVGSDGSNFINGRGGRDRICGRRAGDEIYGGDGDDLVSGDRGHDFLVGDPLRLSGDDRLLGGPGRDDLIGGCGNDVMSGGGGRDDSGWFGNCRSSVSAFDISLRTGIAVADGTDSLSGIEDVFTDGGHGDVPTVLEGNWKNNLLYTGRGDDHLFGRGGNDSLEPNEGENTNDGGRGRDRCLNPRNGEPGATNCEN